MAIAMAITLTMAVTSRPQPLRLRAGRKTSADCAEPDSKWTLEGLGMLVLLHGNAAFFVYSTDLSLKNKNNHVDAALVAVVSYVLGPAS